MLFVAYFLMMVLYHPFTYAANTITATGGGVVEKGKDLILTYNIDKDNDKWSMCRWGRYEKVTDGSNSQGKLDFCLFTDATASSNGSVAKMMCNPSDFMESNQMEYIGATKTECKIKVRNVSMDDSVTWAVNIESDVENKKLDVIVATPLDNVTQLVAPESTEAGSESVVSCTVIGGNPVPDITYLYGAVSSNTTLMVKNNSRVVQTDKLENGKFKTVSNATIIPQIQDNGRQINCVAIQYDKADPKQILFKDSQGTNGSFNANPLTLNVLFPPQPSDTNQTFSYVKDTQAEISITFTSNPKPTNIKWIVKSPNDTNSNTNDTTTPSTTENSKSVDIDLPSTEDKTRYTLHNLTKAEQGSTQYVANLTITNITNSDHLNMYYLAVTNLKGSQNYYFDINVTDFVPTTPVPPSTTPAVPNTTQITPEGKSSSGAVTAVVVIVVIAILLVGGVIFYKKYYLSRQTVPHYNLR